MHGTAADRSVVVGPESVVGPPGTTPTVPCRAVRIATWMWTGVRDDLTAANKDGRPCLLHKLSRPTPLSQFAGSIGTCGPARRSGRRKKTTLESSGCFGSEFRGAGPASRVPNSVFGGFGLRAASLSRRASLVCDRDDPTHRCSVRACPAPGWTLSTPAPCKMDGEPGAQRQRTSDRKVCSLGGLQKPTKSIGLEVNEPNRATILTRAFPARLLFLFFHMNKTNTLLQRAVLKIWDSAAPTTLTEDKKNTCPPRFNCTICDGACSFDHTCYHVGAVVPRIPYLPPKQPMADPACIRISTH
jgi:hypothetical protein